ncbi:thioredoxin family protein [Aureispira anguillae]|uniref:Thioredoxin family protein n=1 Tax=Aureispira anguillae TaxID=2864201 RepID=A0A916DSA8_9BACT|nr:thioredoxin family protein [Aureispira anguillae]BDS11080.1 thioredoxin family protein [Aureispira anguillae]
MKQILFILFFMPFASVSVVAQSNIKNLANKAALDIAIQNNEKVVVFFAAEWCDYCKDFLPKVEELTLIHQEVIFFKINYDENIDFFEKEGIKATPTTVLYKNGSKVDQMVIIETPPLKEKLDHF